MSLLMEALRKAEAAKRAGQSAPAPEADPTPPPAESPVASAQPEHTGVPDKFAFTTTDDLIALAPRETAPEPEIETVPVDKPAVPPAPRVGEGDDVLDDYLTAMHEPDNDE